MVLKLKQEYLHAIKEKFSLTKREVECLYYVGRGMTAKGIGRCLYRSHRTVENHIYNIKYKLGCNTRAELVAVAWKLGLVRPFYES
jgi:DNA-binding CsgD family transcriptional regulator